MSRGTAAIEPKGFIFNVQRFSVHDGPGIRTTVFLKGCPLHCFWCCNPESQSFEADIARKENKCLGTESCGACLSVCSGALSKEGQALAMDRARCKRCGRCAETCPTGAMSVLGRWVTVQEVLDKLEQDSLFYSYSGGGLTLSGGEALMQPQFAAALCREAQKLGLETALETCGYAPFVDICEVIPFVDHILADVKIMDPKAHKRATGVDNKRILENLTAIVEHFPALHVTIRMPVIPKFNDTLSSVREVARFAAGLKGASLELLPYHRLGENKYEQLGREYAIRDCPSPDRECMQALRQEARRFVEVLF